MKSSMFLKFVATLVFTCFTVALSNIRPELNGLWAKYKEGYRKYYSADEDKVRRLLWERNINFVGQHNIETDLGLHPYRLQINRLSDMTEDEVRSKFNTHKMNLTKGNGGDVFTKSPSASLPDSVNWIEEGRVTEVKDQLQCGADWAFSAMGAIEGQVMKQTGQLLALSEQNLVDCSWDQGNKGCSGGDVRAAYNYVLHNGGVNNELVYMYSGQNSMCSYNSKHPAAQMASYKMLPSGDEMALQEAVANVGPISAVIDASSTMFHLYGGGMYENVNCSSTNVNRAVLVVGYGTENGKDYWLVKNSLGTEWGEGGYIRMLRNSNNHCGIATYASFPVLQLTAPCACTKS